MDMNTAGILTGVGGKQDLIMVIQVARVLMETEIGIINGEVMYLSLCPIDIRTYIPVLTGFMVDSLPCYLKEARSQPEDI